MDERISKLEKEIRNIKERNIRVEADKAWETSKARILTITLMTFVIASLVLYFIGIKNFWQSAPSSSK